MGLAFGLIYALGVITGGYGMFFIRAGLMGNNDLRAGADWREFLWSNIPYFALTIAKSWVWPAVLVYWLVSGRPASPWVATAHIGDREVRKVLRRDVAIAEQLIPA